MDQDATWYGGLGPGHIVLDGDRAPLSPRKWAQYSPHFSAHVYRGQTVAHLATAELLLN